MTFQLTTSLLLHHAILLHKLITQCLSSPALTNNISVKYLTIARDLAQLSTLFQDCHIHTILFDMEVYIDLVQSPHILTLPLSIDKEKAKETCQRGRFGTEAVRQITDPCQATLIINLHQNRLKYNEPDLLRLPESCGMFKLRHRIAVELAYENEFDVSWNEIDRTAIYQGGGNLLLAVLYESSQATLLKPLIKSALLVCEYCPNIQTEILCSDIVECINATQRGHRQNVLPIGTEVTWDVKRNERGQFLEEDGPKAEVLSQCLYPRRQSHQDCASIPSDSLLNYITGSLNGSKMSTNHMGEFEFRIPTINWSEDDNSIEDLMLSTEAVAPLQVYPMFSPNRSRTSLRFITAEGVQQEIPSVATYTQPFGLWTWVIGILGFAAIMALMTSVIKAKARSGPIKQMGATLFWMYGTLMDQVNDFFLSTEHDRFKPIVTKLLFLALMLAYALNNLYRAELNVNYVAGNNLFPLWHRIEQLQNFTTIYIPMGPCTYNVAKYDVKHGQDPSVLKDNYMTDACLMKSDSFCAKPPDDTTCFLISQLSLLSYVNMKMYPSCEMLLFNVDVPDSKTPAKDLTGCPDRLVHLLRKLNLKFKYFPLEELKFYVRNNLTQSRTALLTTEYMMPVIWKEFERAMVEDRGLKFSHNYFKPEDAAFREQPLRLQIMSGVEHVYARVVTDRVHNLLTSGVWEFWAEFGRWRRKEVRMERNAGGSDFVPLGVQHDGVYLLFVITGILLGVSVVMFAASFVYRKRDNLNARRILSVFGPPKCRKVSIDSRLTLLNSPTLRINVRA